jgi:hypothetical protein
MLCAVGTAQNTKDRAAPAPRPELALAIADYAALPITGPPDGTGNNAGSLARTNVMREEPAPASRLFVNDLTRPLYILDQRTRKTITYLDFNGRGSRPGLFDKLTTEAGLASGFISFEFDRTTPRTDGSTPSISRRSRCPVRFLRIIRASQVGPGRT